MRELDKCRELRQKIIETEEMIEDISCSIRYPKVPTMSDLPKGSASSTSPIDRYIMLLEKYQNKKLLLETELSQLWNCIEKQMIACNIDKSDRQLMYFRFNSGYPWKVCTSIMRRKEGKQWNENRSFRVYRNVVAMLQKSKVEFGENADS